MGEETERSAEKVRLERRPMTSIRWWCNFVARESTASCGLRSRVATTVHDAKTSSGGWPQGRSTKSWNHGKRALTRQVQKHLFVVT